MNNFFLNFKVLTKKIQKYNKKMKKPLHPNNDPGSPPLVYKIVPFINHQKTTSFHLDNRSGYHYITPNQSPMKYQPNLLNNPLSTPIRNTSTVPVRSANQMLCKTADKRPFINEEIKNPQYLKVLLEENRETLFKNQELSQTNEFLMKKLDILLRENQSLNSMIKDLGRELIETKQKLRVLLESEENGANYAAQFEELEIKIQSLTKENERLVKLIEIQNREESSLIFLEEKIDCLLEENQKLNNLIKKEREISSECKKELSEMKQGCNLEYENKVLEYKMQELQRKLQVIFEDNDKLESVIRSQNKEQKEMKEKYDKEIEKNMHHTAQIKDLLIKIKDLQEALQIKQLSETETQKVLEEKLLLEHEKLELEEKLKDLLGENEKLNDCLEEILEKNQRKEEFEGKKNESIDLLLKENKKLQNFVEKASQDKGDSREMTQENLKLRILLEEKEQSEEFWKEKYHSLEKKLKLLL